MSDRLGTYLLQLWERSAKGSILLTDKLSIILIPLFTVGFWLLEQCNLISSESDIELTELVSFVIVSTIVGSILFRLLASPYLLWKDQNVMIATLDTKLAEPEQIERKWIADHLAKTRSELAAALSEVAAFSLNSRYTNVKIIDEMEKEIGEKVDPRIKAEKLDEFNKLYESYKLSVQTVKIKSQELSYLPTVSDRCLDFVRRCERLWLENTRVAGRSRLKGREH